MARLIKKKIEITLDLDKVDFANDAWILFDKIIKEDANYFLRRIIDFIDSISIVKSNKYNIIKDHVEKTNVIYKINKYKKTGCKWWLIVLDILLYLLPLLTRHEYFLKDGKINIIPTVIILAIHALLIILVTIKHTNN